MKSFILLIFLLLFNRLVYADMLKCQINPTVWNYFDAKDAKESKKCITKPIVVVSSSGEKISNHYKTIKPKQKLVAAKDVKPISSCGGSGGTVRVNGKVFHLDSNFLCNKYGPNATGKGHIYAASTVGRTYPVDAAYRRKISRKVAEVARKYNMDPAFIHAVISAESAYNPNARSHAGAEGLMQLMPFTAKRFGVTNSFNPYQNIEAGTKYLSILYKEFGSLSLAAAGYNAGEGAVRKYNNSIPPYKETINYVPKVLAFYNKYKNNRSLITAN